MSHDFARELPTADDEIAADDGVAVRLAKEAADWSAGRSGRARARPVESVPADVKPVPRPAKLTGKRAAKPEQPKAVSVPAKPHSMSYDGVSWREYMDQVIARGTR